MYGAFGVTAALAERATTGAGRIVRTSLLAGMVGAHAFQGTRWTVGGELPQAQGNQHPSIAPYGLFRCADGSVQIAIGSDGLWRKFVDGFGIDSGALGLTTNSDRAARRDLLIEVVEKKFAPFNAHELLARLTELGIPAGRVRTLDEVYSWDQVASQRLLIDLQHDAWGPMRLPGSALRFFDIAGTELTHHHAAPPALDEHGPAIRRWLDEGGDVAQARDDA